MPTKITRWRRGRTSRVLRRSVALSRGTFSGAIFLADIALVAAMSCPLRLSPRRLRQPGQHLVLTFSSLPSRPYLLVLTFSSLPSRPYLLVLTFSSLPSRPRAASIFIIFRLVPPRIPAVEFCFKPHARRAIQLWNVTLICLFMLGFWRRSASAIRATGSCCSTFQTLAALIVQRYFIVRITVLARAGRIHGAHAIVAHAYQNTC
jgi:hypothetical protein